MSSSTGPLSPSRARATQPLLPALPAVGQVIGERRPMGLVKSFIGVMRTTPNDYLVQGNVVFDQQVTPIPTWAVNELDRLVRERARELVAAGVPADRIQTIVDKARVLRPDQRPVQLSTYRSMIQPSPVGMEFAYDHPDLQWERGDRELRLHGLIEGTGAQRTLVLRVRDQNKMPASFFVSDSSIPSVVRAVALDELKTDQSLARVDVRVRVGQATAGKGEIFQRPLTTT